MVAVDRGRRSRRGRHRCRSRRRGVAVVLETGAAVYAGALPLSRARTIFLRQLGAIAFLLIAHGCGGTTITDPCAGVAGKCVGLQVRGSSSVSGIYRAAVHVTGGGIDRTRDATPQNGQATSLPIAIALIFDSVPTPPAITIDVTGFLGGAP